MGFFPGVIIVFFILNKKGASCSYFPNERVISESLSKNFVYSDNFSNELEKLNISEKFIRDSLLKYGKINFSKSDAQKKPCPVYFLTYPKQNPKYEMEFEKCKENATFIQIKKHIRTE